MALLLFPSHDKGRRTGGMEMIPPADVGNWVQNKLEN